MTPGRGSRALTWAIALCAVALVGVILSQFVHGTAGAFLADLAGAAAVGAASAIVRGVDRRRAAVYRKRQARARWAHQQELKSRVRFTDLGNP